MPVNSSSKPSVFGPALTVSLLFVVVQFVLVVVFLGAYPFGGSSEAREAQVVNAMLVSGDFVLPLRNGLIPSKPPLFHWLGLILTVGGGALGVVSAAVTSEFLVRFVSLLAGSVALFAVVSNTGRLAARHLGMPGGAEIAAWVSGAALSLTYGFHVMLSDARVDMLFASSCVASWIWLLGSVDAPDRPGFSLRNGGFLAFAGSGFFAGLAVLTKGPLGIVLPGIWIGILALRLDGFRGCRPLLAKFLVWGVVAVAVALPWYAAAALHGGQGFVARQIFFENLTRFQGGEFVNSEVWWLYFPSILRNAFPWSLLAAAGMFLLPKLNGNRPGLRPILDALALVLVVSLLFFSSASGKRHSYLLPLYPIVAQFLGLFAAQAWRDCGLLARQKTLSVIRPLPWVGFALLILMLFAIEFAAAPIRWESVQAAYLQRWISGVKPLFLWTGASALLFGAVAQWRWGERLSNQLQIGVFMFMAVLSLASHFGIAAKNELKSFPSTAARVRELVADPRELKVLRHQREEYLDPVLYYLRYHEPIWAPPFDAVGCPRYVLAVRKNMEQFKSTLAERGLGLEELASIDEVADVGKASNPDTEVVLARCNVEVPSGGRVP
jgi:4-amino-4-deoxy-L-arabinose transferase-like glycosyltransferase